MDVTHLRVFAFNASWTISLVLAHAAVKFFLTRAPRKEEHTQYDSGCTPYATKAKTKKQPRKDDAV